MFGMSDEFGMMALGSIRNQYLDGGYGLDCAQDTAAVMDKAVKAILDQCYQDAVELIQENLEDMHKVVAYLLEKETITGGEMVAIIQGRDPALVEDAYASTHEQEPLPLPGTSSPPPRTSTSSVSRCLRRSSQTESRSRAVRRSRPPSPGMTRHRPLRTGKGPMRSRSRTGRKAEDRGGAEPPRFFQDRQRGREKV